MNASILSILISIFMGLCGVFLILTGGTMGFLGVWVDGPFDSVWLRLWGVGLFLLGVVYVSPVLVFQRRRFILTYGLSALCVTAFAVAAFALDPSTEMGSPGNAFLLGGLLVFLPVSLCIAAWIKMS